ncbi:CHC2 zinc finger domain-containing protein [Stenotrophomonas maltophilia]|uniref:CHC2 zinc finger domain-containing protein n=1 Tax=Stenotrophomonas maltophilia TaxID=40324 RepID=UPI0009B29D46|nr:CHC2 zinc finger domain-containing protein [Stenotrophomonas maltophilia]
MAWYDVGALLGKVPLEDLVSRLGLKTERRGHQVTALCPFHQDTRPSLNLYAAANGLPAHFHCFACGAHGNAIDLVKEVNGGDFKDSVEWLARNYGIQPTRGGSPNGQMRTRRLSALDFALRQFDGNHDASRFERWCVERGFNEKFLYRKGLRCITGPVLVAATKTLPIGDRLELLDGLLELGLVRRLRRIDESPQFKLDYRDQFSDYFSDGRIVIPIYDTEKSPPKPVGFAGRLLDTVAASDAPKYRLTPGFRKAEHLFNAQAAFAGVAAQLKADRPSTLYLVEGFLDALRLEYLGQHAVALMGTSLSKEQYGLLSRLVETRPDNAQPLNLSVFLDNDPAGFSGADRLVRDLLGLTGVDLQWIGIPWRTRPGIGKDPDTCLRDACTQDFAQEWLMQYSVPAEAVLLIAALGGKDSSALEEGWQKLPTAARERALFRAARSINRSRGRRQHSVFLARLGHVGSEWARELGELLAGDAAASSRISKAVYLDGQYERTALARTLAYFGSRRGELPCDEEAWLTLGANAYLFDTVALDRLKSVTAEDGAWRQAAPFEAVNLPRKLSSDEKVLGDPRLKVMPHPADLHVHQIFLNELLTERHDRLSADGKTFSASIPAVRWYSSRNEVVVSGPYPALNDPDLHAGEPATLSFGYQVDMEVLEGHKTPSDQGMFRPFGQCWRDFMVCLSQQCHAIGKQVHVLRLDVQRYYDSVQQFVVRDRLLTPLIEEVEASGLPTGLAQILSLKDDQDGGGWAESLERLLQGFLFGYSYRNPEQRGHDAVFSEESMGIPQGPVISAYIGTIALFPVDNCARQFIRESSRTSEGGQISPRAGYARYVDDIVIFADSAQLLGQLREALQAEAQRLSFALIHKGERVRAGSPEHVMQQLNEGRGLAASVPGWEAPLVGDGEAGWDLSQDAPSIDRQCALQMLRHPDLLTRPGTILPQVQAAMAAKELRPNDIGICTRWLWWLVALECKGPELRTSEEVWAQYWTLWESACEALVERWDRAFERHGYHWLYAIEGLDRLLDPNPWIENGQTISEVPKSRANRERLAQAVCQVDFFRFLKGADAAKENLSHLRRRARLTAMKARRLSRRCASRRDVDIHRARPVTSVEWLCLAAEVLNAGPDTGIDSRKPLNPLTERGSARFLGGDGLSLANAVRDLLADGGEAPGDSRTRGLAIDFVLNSVPEGKGLEVLTKFEHLFRDEAGDGLELIANLPVAREQASLYAMGGGEGGLRKHIYVCTLPPHARQSRDFIRVALGDRTPVASFSTIQFGAEQHVAACLAMEKSAEVPWKRIDMREMALLGSQTQLAAALFEGLYAMHRDDHDESVTYVPFKPQLVQNESNGELVVHLVGEPVQRDLLGVNAWFHDDDGRVRATSVPQLHADIWRVGWAVADLLGIAASMSGETSNREETLAEDVLSATPSNDRDQVYAEQLESYVLRQQLRKLQGAYISEAQTDLPMARSSTLPGTVSRALHMLRSYPSNASVRTRTQHVLAMEAQTKAMAIRLCGGAGSDLRNALHLVFPRAIEHLPLWVLQGMGLVATGPIGMRPELGLMHSLYDAMEDAAALRMEQTPTKATALKVALALAVATAGLRGSAAALWGLMWGNTNRLSELPRIPETWVLPEAMKADPQSDYRAICKWLTDGDDDALARATPWHWMLAMTGLLDASFPQALAIPALATAFSALGAWQFSDSASDAASETDETDETIETEGACEESIWPFEDLPTLSVLDCDSLVNAITSAIASVDAIIGVHVVQANAPRFGRDPHTGEFTDATGKGWQMSMPQYSYLGRKGPERVEVGRSKLSTWTESRRTTDDELLAVHWLNGKLGRWYGMCREHATIRAAGPSGQVQAIALGEVEPSPSPAVEAKVRLARSESDAAPAADAPPTPQRPEKDSLDADTRRDAPSRRSNADSEIDVLAELRHLQRASFDIRKRKSTADGSGNEFSHFRVALLQLSAHDSYCHPLAEVGIDGLPLSKAARDVLASKLTSKDLKAVRKAARAGSEHNWKDTLPIVSWPEHRRRAVLEAALDACHGLGVELLVLPEVSLRKETIDWMKRKMANHYPGLAVLAGTYRNFSAQNHPDHLKELLTLLWRPEKSLLDEFRLEERTTIELSRGKKYRSVASHELFRPDLKELAPLYSDRSVMDAILQLREDGKLEDSWTSDQVRGLMVNLAEGSPRLRHCMELICSELFLLTSPANRKPLVQELEKVLSIFEAPAGVVADAKNMVNRDLEAVGDLLTIAQTQRERRSVLLVPAHTNRTNDYWHAGQASVLASGTATVFCNAVLGGASGESCFIGIDSVTRSHSAAGTVRLMTPYHGWHTGILQPDCKGALSSKDQALVVVDIDPVHVVSGRPRPQLLPEPMALVAYLPVVEVVDKAENDIKLAKALVHSDKPHLSTPDETENWLQTRAHEVTGMQALLNRWLFNSKDSPRTKEDFAREYQALEKIRLGAVDEVEYLALMEKFSEFFGDPRAVCERFDAWHRNNHQQPGSKKGTSNGYEPAWVDFLIADLTCGGELPTLDVPAWCDRDSYRAAGAPSH